MSTLNDPVLVLNRHWVPVNTCTVREAFKRLFAETARFIDTKDESLALHDFSTWVKLQVTEGRPFIETWNSSILAPEVIVMGSACKNEKRRNTMTYSRRHLAKRDHHTCQYCGEQRPHEEMTIDHVMPRSRGGPSSWTNCVMSCFDCNSTKGDRTPEEAGMKLLTRPYEPGWSPIYRIPPTKYKESWKNFVADHMN